MDVEERVGRKREDASAQVEALVAHKKCLLGFLFSLFFRCREHWTELNPCSFFVSVGQRRIIGDVHLGEYSSWSSCIVRLFCFTAVVGIVAVVVHREKRSIYVTKERGPRNMGWQRKKGGKKDLRDHKRSRQEHFLGPPSFYYFFFFLIVGRK